MSVSVHSGADMTNPQSWSITTTSAALVLVKLLEGVLTGWGWGDIGREIQTNNMKGSPKKSSISTKSRFFGRLSSDIAF